MSFKITGPGLYRTRDGRKAEVANCVESSMYPWRGQSGGFHFSWMNDGRFDKDIPVDTRDLVAPWEEVYLISEQLVPEKLASETHTSCPPTPYHRTEQFRAETARMLFVQLCAQPNRLTMQQDAGEAIMATNALIAALDTPQPPTP